MQMVLSGSKCIASYDPDTGKLLWIVDGPTDQFVASPVFSETTGLFYITGGFPDHHVVAIRPDGSGNVTATHIVWHHHAGAGVSYVSSPIIEGGWLLCRVVKPAAKFAVIATNDLGEATYASPALSHGQIFLRTDQALYCIGPAKP